MPRHPPPSHPTRPADHGAPGPQDPVFARLVGHPRLMEAMVDIDGTEFLYQGSQAHHRLPDDNGPWHCVRMPPS